MTELYYYGARYYDPGTGRFITRDLATGQLTNPQTLNRYTYVMNNPLKYRDPDGCEQAGALTNGGSSGYPSTDSLGGPMSWSWAPQNIGKVSPGDPACIVAMFTLFGLIGLFYLGPVALMKLWELGKLVISYGADIARVVLNCLGKVLKVFSGLKAKYKLAIIIAVLIQIAEYIARTYRKMKDPSGADSTAIYAEDGKTLIAVITVIETMGGTGYERGQVILLNEPGPEDDMEYEYKREGGVYYVLIDGEWVEMPSGWKPGNLPKP